MKASINGIEINYEVSGKEGAPWLVLSHSLACTVRMWDPQVDAFQSRFRILNYDMRGHGATSAPQGPCSLEMLADDVLGLMKHLQISKAAYCGLSIGGMIGQTLALKAPGSFTKMVLADTTHTQPPEALKQWEAASPSPRARAWRDWSTAPWSAGSPSLTGKRILLNSRKFATWY